MFAISVHPPDNIGVGLLKMSAGKRLVEEKGGDIALIPLAFYLNENQVAFFIAAKSKGETQSIISWTLNPQRLPHLFLFYTSASVPFRQLGL